MDSEFIKQTAIDYDIDYNIVEKIYLTYHESGNFYIELEKIVTNRLNN